MSEFQRWSSQHRTIRASRDWNALLDHGLEKTASYIIRKNGSYVEAINGSTGKIDYGGANNAGGVSGSDAAAVIQATVDALSLDGGKISFKNGIYQGDIILDAISKGIEVLGEGRESTVIQGQIKLTTYAWYSKIGHLTIDASDLSTGEAALYIEDSAYDKFEGILIKNLPADTIGINLRGLVSGRGVRYNSFKDIRIMSANSGTIGIKTEGATEAAVYANSFENCHLPVKGTSIYVGTQSTRNYFKECCAGGMDIGIDLYGTNNIFENCDFEGAVTTELRVNSGATGNQIRGGYIANWAKPEEVVLWITPSEYRILTADNLDVNGYINWFVHGKDRFMFYVDKGGTLHFFREFGDYDMFTVSPDGIVEWRGRKRGVATIPNGSSSVVVDHGLYTTPQHVMLTGTHSEVKDCWVTNVTSTQFTINAPAAVSANRNVYWWVER